MGKAHLQLVRVLALAVTLTGVSRATSAQEAVLTGGNFHSNNSISISWSLGEAAIHTLTGGENIITQGFQQTKLTVTSVNEIPGVKMIVTAYPNPAHDFIYLKVDGEHINLNYVVIDLNGRMLKQGKVENNPMTVTFNNLNAGIYFIRITKEGREIQTFKIVKQ